MPEINPKDGASMPTGETPAAATAAEKPRRRRWGRRLGMAFLLLLLALGVLVGLAPRIASTQAVSNYAMAKVNDQLRGAVHLEQLAVSWSGPIEIRGVRVTDAGQREVLRATKITCPTGLWRLARSPEAFGEVSIEGLRAVLVLTADNQMTLAQAFEPRQPAAPQAPAPAGPLPEPRGKLIIRNASVQVVKSDGATYEVPDLSGEVEVQTLDDVKGRLQVTLAEGGKLVGELALRSLVTQGALRPQNATGTVALHTEGSVKLGPLARFAAPQAGVEAEAGLQMQAKLASGTIEATYAAEVRGLQTKDRAAAKASPIDATVKGELQKAGEKITAHTQLAGDAGTARADAILQIPEKPLDFSATKILAAILTGEALTLPEMDLDAEASLDLAALGRAVPGLLKVRADQEITAGKLEFSKKVSAHAGSPPTVTGTLALTDVTARSGETVTRLEPVTCDFDTALEAGKGLQVRKVELNSSFAQFTASGAASELQAKFQADLAKLQAELGRVFDLGAAGLAGAVSGTLQVGREGDARINVALQMDAEKLNVGTGDRRFELPHAKLSQNGYLTLTNQQPEKYTASEAKVNLNDEVVLIAAGWYGLQQSAFHADVNLERADLRFVAGRAQALGVAELARYSGAVAAQASVDCAGGAQPVVSGGSVTTKGLQVDAQPLLDGDATLQWKGVQLAADGQAVQLESAQVESPLATVTAKGVRWQAGSRLQLDGAVEGSADLARCMTTVGRIGKMEKPPAIAGRLGWNTQCSTAGSAVKLVGKGGVDGLEIGAGEQAVREQRVDFEYDGQIDNASEKITLNTCRLASAPLSAEITGTVEKYKTAAVLALAGRYDASWDALTSLLHELAPATAQTVIVQGKTGSTFKVTGPVNQAGATPAFRGLKSGLEIGWESAALYGVPVGATKLAPALADGQVTLPPTAIPVAEGSKVQLGAVVDLQPAEPTLRVPGTLQVVDTLAVTPQLSEAVLSRINPIFMHMTSVEGTMSLALQDIVLPLGESMQTGGAGQGHLVLDQMKIQPGGLMGELIALGGMGESDKYAVAVSGLDFVLKDGRIRYENFTLTFPNEFDLKFYGSVGFDDTLDLVVSLPVRAALLERLGVKGPLAEYAKDLTGSRVDIPVMGTRQQPKLDLSKVDVKALLKPVLEKAGGKAVEGLLDGLKGKEQQSPPADKAPEAAPEPAPEQAEEKAPEKKLDDLRKLLPGSKPESQPAGKP